MRKSAVVLLALAIVAPLSFGCGEDENASDPQVVPDRAQILPHDLDGIVVFDMVKNGETHHIDVVFGSGGREDLVVSDVRIEGDEMGAFTLGEPVPSSLEVPYGDALGVPITLGWTSRGVALATLVVESNAENYPTIELALVGPMTADPFPSNPDIVLFEENVSVEPSPYGPQPVAFARFYNLGADPLNISDYELADTDNFRFLVGTAEPGAACELDAICVDTQPPAEGCCPSGMNCLCTSVDEQDGCLESRCHVVISSGFFSVLGVTFTDTAAAGELDTVLTIRSNDPDTAATTVNISGTRN